MFPFIKCHHSSPPLILACWTPDLVKNRGFDLDTQSEVSALSLTSCMIGGKLLLLYTHQPPHL